MQDWRHFAGRVRLSMVIELRENRN